MSYLFSLYITPRSGMTVLQVDTEGASGIGHVSGVTLRVRNYLNILSLASTKVKYSNENVKNLENIPGIGI